MDGLRPMSPNYIQVGMMNCRVAKPLPENLAEFLDGAGEHGAIFVSFGSVLTGTTRHDAALFCLLPK
jgi:glucuronosyltransferase